MTVGVKVIHRFGGAARDVKIFFIEENRDGMWVEVHAKHGEVISFLAVEQAVP